jgi:hypothetical protein
MSSVARRPDTLQRVGRLAGIGRLRHSHLGATMPAADAARPVVVATSAAAAVEADDAASVPDQRKPAM